MTDKKLPTKVELLAGTLVDFTVKHKAVATNTLKIAAALGVRHSDVTKIVRRLFKKGKIDSSLRSPISRGLSEQSDYPNKEDGISPRTCAQSDYLNERGRAYKFFELDETSALQVIMNMTGDKADELHKRVAIAFVSMKSELIDWRTGRKVAVETTKLANDALHKLGIRLKEQHPNSKKVAYIFNHFQGAITKRVTGISRTDRQHMTSVQLQEVSRLEMAVNAAIEPRLAEDPMKVRNDVFNQLKEGAYDG